MAAGWMRGGLRVKATKRSMVWLTPSLGGGGAERTLINLAHAFERRGVRCAIGVWDREQAYVTQIPVTRVGHKWTLCPELWPVLGVDALRQLEAAISADATVSFTPLANLLNARAGGSHPRYLSIRTTLSRALFGPTGFGYRALMRQHYPRATKIIAISRFVADDAVSYLGLDPSLVETLYNPIPIDEVQSLSAEPLPDPWDCTLGDRFSIVATGRLSAEKGHALLLRVASAMKQRGIDVRVLLLGRGAHEADYANLARSLGLRVARAFDSHEAQASADVVFCGFLSNPFPFVRRADVFAFPSALEGLGQSLLEALACGTTIVASDCDSGPREILAPETDYRRRTLTIDPVSCGLLLPPPTVDWKAVDARTVDEWVSALLHVRTHGLDTRRACLERARDFAIESVVEHWFRTLGW